MPLKVRPMEASAAFEIWQAGGRIVSIDNPVRMKILRHLEQGPRTLNELVATTKKAKSTLSALHMPFLLKAGLISQSLDPNDSRVKWFKLQGSRLGSSAVDAGALRDAVLGYVQASGILPLRPILDVIEPARLYTKEQREYADGVAQRLGALVGRMLLTKNPAERAKELSRILEREGMGRIEWSGQKVAVAEQDPWAKRFLQRLAETAIGGTAE